MLNSGGGKKGSANDDGAAIVRHHSSGPPGTRSPFISCRALLKDPRGSSDAQMAEAPLPERRFVESVLLWCNETTVPPKAALKYVLRAAAQEPAEDELVKTINSAVEDLGPNPTEDARSEALEEIQHWVVATDGLRRRQGERPGGAEARARGGGRSHSRLVGVPGVQKTPREDRVRRRVATVLLATCGLPGRRPGHDFDRGHVANRQGGLRRELL
mmetsp:Transcript_1042/g.3442  ORF Transcript_1042/g.3442 Transcript_1042/m.3442 type:complete len:215 (-) Transcript_1042:223-867(-)